MKSFRLRVPEGAGLGSALLLGLCGGVASAQPIVPEGNLIMFISGELLSADGEPAPEPGDRVRAVVAGESFEFAFSSGQSNARAFEIQIIGDDPDTEEVEGPQNGDDLSFEFFDSSRNVVRVDVAALNDAGETVSVDFEGEQSISIPIGGGDLPPDFGGVVRELDLILGVLPPGGIDGGGGGGNGGGGSGGGGSTGGNPDVNGDGKVDARDTAMVIRSIVAGPALRSFQQLNAADVDGNGVVNVADAIRIVRGGPPPTPPQTQATASAADEEDGTP